jgi:hypothetical protein
VYGLDCTIGVMPNDIYTTLFDSVNGSTRQIVDRGFFGLGLVISRTNETIF